MDYSVISGIHGCSGQKDGTGVDANPEAKLLDGRACHNCAIYDFDAGHWNR